MATPKGVGTMPHRLDVFDPALCCSTGVCGPSPDPALPRFAADLDWLRQQGVSVSRHNLSQEPGVFATNAIVREALERDGVEALPLVLVDGRVVAQGRYPERGALAVAAGVAPAEPAAARSDGASACCAPSQRSAKPRVSKGGCC
jgi:hypothetical protein